MATATGTIGTLELAGQWWTALRTSADDVKVKWYVRWVRRLELDSDRFRADNIGREVLHPTLGSVPREVERGTGILIVDPKEAFWTVLGSWKLRPYGTNFYAQPMHWCEGPFTLEVFLIVLVRFSAFCFCFIFRFYHCKIMKWDSMLRVICGHLTVLIVQTMNRNINSLLWFRRTHQPGETCSG